MNILILTTYPVETPRHGGQIRTAEIVRFYRARGYHVEIAGVLGSPHYPASNGFVTCPSPDKLSQWISPLFLMEDVAIGRHFANNEQAFLQLQKAIQKSPDVIHVEQPWLMAFAQRYRETQQQPAALIYGSQNIEAPLKEAITRPHHGTRVAAQLAQQVADMEAKALELADGVVAVSANDAGVLQPQTRKPLVIAANGVTDRVADKRAFQLAHDVSQGTQFALYCASAHPPNLEGFFDWLGGSNAALDFDQRLVVAGSVADAIENDPRFQRSPGLPQVFVNAGVVDNTTLAGLIGAAHCMLLPISAGGGTNLKTAEALYSGHHVLATPKAMRGFESFTHHTGVHVTQTPAQFKRHLRLLMQQPPLALTSEARQARQKLDWHHCLQPLEELLSCLAA